MVSSVCRKVLGTPVIFLDLNESANIKNSKCEKIKILSAIRRHNRRFKLGNWDFFEEVLVKLRSNRG